MSLINKMLQDLDTRQSENGVRSRLPNEVRALPQGRRPRLPLVLAGIACLVLALLAAAGVARHADDSGPPAAPVLTTLLPIAPVTLYAEPVNDSEAAAHADSPGITGGADARSPDADDFAAALPTPALEFSLRLSELLPLPEPKKVDASAAPKVARAESFAEPVRRPAPPAQAVAALAPPAAVPAASAATGKPAPAAAIEKMEAFGSPHESAESAYRKAIAALNQGRLSEARDGLHTALRADAMHFAARQLLFKVLVEAGQTDEAIELLRIGLHGQPGQLGWAMNLARLQLERRDLGGAWETLDRSLPAAARNADYQGFAAHVLQRLGRNKEAVDYFQAAARLAPSEGRWWLGLGLTLEADGHAAEAREAFARAKSSGTLNAELATLVEQKLH